jgi:hypothetical protein
MRKAYSINYDLSAPGRDYKGLYDALKEFGGWWHYLESTWIVVTDSSPAQIWEKLKPHIDENDSLLIIEVKDNVSGWLSQKAWDWIHENVPKP